MTLKSVPPLMQLNDICKVFYTEELETHALRDVSLQVQSGEFLSIAGPSGCGKSTLLGILGLLESPTSGSFELESQRIDELSGRERARIRNRRIGFVFQAFNLIPDLDVHGNVALPLNYRDDYDTTQSRQAVQEALERVGIAHREHHYPAQLSGGQQQRVAVARALVAKPAILLADEPTGNLDSRNGEAVMDLLGELHQEGSTICMVTHDSRFAGYADRTVHLFDGHVVDEEMRPRPAAA